MRFEQLASSLFGFHGDQFVALRFETVDNIANDAALDSVGFNLKEVANVSAGREKF